MEYSLIFIGLTALLSVSFAQTRRYYFVNTLLNWTDAQTVCRSNYTDLATLENSNDVTAVLNTSSSYTGWAWIGLSESWTWSLEDSSFYGGQTSYTSWYPGYPYYSGQEDCVVFNSHGQWIDASCSSAFYFVCYNGTVNGQPSFLLIFQFLTWTQAQSYCRQNYVDLASVRNQADNDLILNIILYYHYYYVVWIGLYRKELWSDGSNSSFRYWVSGHPTSGSDCVASSFSDSGKWYEDPCSQSFPFICYSNAPLNADGFEASGQSETSITLQWNQVNNVVSFVLQFNGTETNISPPTGDGPVTFTVSSLTAGNNYTFTLFSVFENIRSSGVQVTAATAPPNPNNFMTSGHNETSITLQWDKVNNNVSFVIQFNGTETNISAPTGDGPVNFTVSSLTARTEYTFTLFSVFENMRSSGVSITADTGPDYVVVMNAKLESLVLLSESEIEDALIEIFQQYGLSPEISVKARIVKP